MRRGTITALAVLAAATAFSAGALAAAPYSVSVKFPRFVSSGQSFHLRAAGTAGTLSHLTVFIASRRCAATIGAEAKRSSRVIISANVSHSYTRSKKVRAKEGTYHVCAYLTAAGHRSITRARATGTYYGLVGGY